MEAIAIWSAGVIPGNEFLEILHELEGCFTNYIWNN